MTFTIKLGHLSRTRKVTFDEQPTWDELASKIAQLYGLRKGLVAVSYLDVENDQVTISSNSELSDYFHHFLREGETARFTVQVASAPPVPQVDEDAVDLLLQDEQDALMHGGPASADSDWQDIESGGPTAEQDGRSEVYGSTFWGGLEEAFAPTSRGVYGPEGANFIAGMTAIRNNPDILLDVSRILSPRSTATLIQVLDDSDASDTESEREYVLPARSDKGKNKEVAFQKAFSNLNMNTAPSIRDSEVDFRAIDQTTDYTIQPTVRETAPAPAPDPEPPAHAPEPAVYYDRPASVIPSIETVPPSEPDPPAPEVAPPEVVDLMPESQAVSAVPRETQPNIIGDIASLIGALQTAFTMHPELASGIRHFMRDALIPSPPPSVPPEEVAISESERAPTERAPTERAPTERAPTERAPTVRAPTERAPSRAATAVGYAPTPIQTVLQTLKASIAAQSAVDPSDYGGGDYISEAPTMPRSAVAQHHLAPNPPPPPHREHRHRNSTSRAGHHHHSAVPSQMGGGSILSPGSVATALPTIPAAFPVAPPLPPPGTAMGVWIAPTDRMSPFLYYQPYVPHDGQPPPPPPPPPHMMAPAGVEVSHHHHRAPQARSVSNPFPVPVMQAPMQPPQMVLSPAVPPINIVPSSTVHAPSARAPTVRAPTVRAPTARAPTTRAPTAAASVRAPTRHVPSTRAPSARAPRAPTTARAPESINPPTNAPESVVEEQRLVPAPQPTTHEQALAALSERKTQLELAKERYRIEKQKWKEEKEARRRERDREIERLTGRRVLTREERQERKRLEGGADPGPSGLWDDKKDVKGFGDQPMLHIGGSAALNSSNPADSHPMGHIPSSRPTTITAPPPYAVPRGGGGAAPSTTGRVSRRNSRVRDRSNTATGRHAAPGPSPLTDQPKPGGAIAAAAQAHRLVDKLEDMGFSPSTHPRLQEIVHDQTVAHPETSDEDALRDIMEAIVNLQPSTSGTRHD